MRSHLVLEQLLFLLAAPGISVRAGSCFPKMHDAAATAHWPAFSEDKGPYLLFSFLLLKALNLYVFQL